MLLLLFACAGPALQANPDESDWPTLDALDRQVLTIMDQDRIPGLSACILRDGALVWCQGYGYADVDAARPVTPDTPFLLASVSKAVVGVAMMRAVEDGLLTLDDPVETWLPFTPRHPDAPNTPITPRQLAAHTSGIDDNWGVMDSLYTDGDPTLDLGTFLEGYLVPGGEWYDERRNFVGDGPEDLSSYANIGAALAGLVIEEATGTAFPAWCEAQIFTPLAMNHSAWTLAESDESTLALPYEWRAGRFVTDGHYGFPDYPSGALRSSSTDIAAVLGMMMAGGGAVLEPASVDELLRAQYPALDAKQALFWYHWTLAGEPVWGHNGGELGASTEILAREDGLGVVVLMNAEGYDDTLARVERKLLDAAGEL